MNNPIILNQMDCSLEPIEDTVTDPITYSPNEDFYLYGEQLIHKALHQATGVVHHGSGMEKAASDLPTACLLGCFAFAATTLHAVANLGLGYSRLGMQGDRGGHLSRKSPCRLQQQRHSWIDTCIAATERNKPSWLKPSLLS
ncbi:UNVERIFIED_CONTAM: hypothetical protein K2H54_046104 [Gekko kuhli]